MDRWLIVAIVVVVVFAGWWVSRRARETSHAPDHVEPRDLGLEPGDGVAAVLFTSPYCVACAHWAEALDTTGTPYLRLDVKAHPDLARRYRVRHTPLVLAVRAASGEVAAAYEDEPTPGDVSHIAALVAR